MDIEFIIQFSDQKIKNSLKIRFLIELLFLV